MKLTDYMSIIPQLKQKHRRMEGVPQHEKVTIVHISLLILWTEQLATMTPSLTEEWSPGTSGTLERKEPRFPTRPRRLKSFPFYSCHPRGFDRRMEEGGAQREAKADISAASRERKGRDHRSCQNTRRTVGQGSSQAPRDLVRCRVWDCGPRMWPVALATVSLSKVINYPAL